MATNRPTAPQSTSVLAVDPGLTQSAYVIWDGSKIHGKGILSNRQMLLHLSAYSPKVLGPQYHLAIEMIANMGMPAGTSLFQTAVWIGYFLREWEGKLPHPKWWSYVYRKDVKIHLCGSMRAKDGNVSQALRDRVGERGTKKAPGVTYGVAKDVWQALGVAVTWWDLNTPSPTTATEPA